MSGIGGGFSSQRMGGIGRQLMQSWPSVSSTVKTYRTKMGQAVRHASSDSSNPLAGDAGGIATHVYHNVNTFLVISTPLFLMAPDSWTAGPINQGWGVLMSATMSAHSWIGLNYVATDYVPKVSKALLGPSRIAAAGIATITFLGLSQVALFSEGGIKGMLKALWTKAAIKEGTKEKS